MKWTIQQLNALKHKGIEFDEFLDLGDISKQDPQIRSISPVHVKGRAIYSKDIISFPLEIEGTITLPCSRTLANVQLPFEIQTMERFIVNQSWQTDFDDELGDDIHPVEGEVIDLIPYIKEHILLQIPLQIFSDSDKGEAPPSGKDWELVTEEQMKDRIDPRLADLAKFFEK